MEELSGEHDPFPVSPCRARSASALLAAVFLLAAACGESPQAPAPSPGGPASVSVVASIEAAGDTASQQQGEGGLGAAFEAADVATVRVVASGGSVLADREVGFDPGSGGAELSLELTIEDDRVPVTVELALRRGSDALFEGATGVTLVAGEMSTAELGLSAVPAAVAVPEGPVTLTAIGDTARLDGAVVFATGDTIPGVSPTWSSSDAAVADVTADGTVVADAPGTAEAVATHEGLSASVALEVAPEVATVAVEPDSAAFSSLSGSTDFSVTVTDANGNPVTDEPVTWSSTDAQVAAVDGQGLAEARGDGSASVVAEAMGMADTAAVTVDLGPSGRVSGRVGRVRPQSSASVAASSSASGGSVGAAIATDPAGGVEVRFLQGGEVVSRTTTDADGTWTSPAIPPGVYTLEYASPDLVTVRHEGVEIAEGSTGSVEEVPMVPASDQPGTVAGSVLSSRDGSGVDGATVELRAGIDNPDGGVVATGTAGADGSYEITGVEPGTYTITGTAPDFARDAITGVALGGETFGGQDLELVPPPAVTIGSPTDGAAFTTADVIPFRGTADDPEQGSLTGDALVWTSDQAGQIGTGESFTTALPAGEHTITLTATNDRGASGEASVEVSVEAQAGLTVEITAPNDGDAFTQGTQITFEGSATDPDAGQLTGESLVWSSDIDGTFGSGTTTQATLSTGSHTVTLEATAPDGDVATASISVSVAAGRVFVGDESTGDVTLIDPTNAEVVASFTVQGNATDVAGSPDGTTAYVTDGFGVGLSVVDLASATVTSTIPLGSDSHATAVDLSPDGSTAYVADGSLNELAVIDLGAGTVTNTIPVGGDPTDLVVTADGSRALITNGGNGGVTVVDLSSASVIADIGFSTSNAIDLARDGAIAYATDPDASSITAIDVSTATVVDNISLGGTPVDLEVTPGGSTFYTVTEGLNDELVELVATLNGGFVNDFTSLATAPNGVAVGPDGGTIWVSNVFEVTVYSTFLGEGPTISFDRSPIVIGSVP